jgi:hypothetical protein
MKSKNKLVIFSLLLVLLMNISFVISEESSTVIDNFSLSKGWNLVYGLKDPSQIIGQGSNSQDVSVEEIRSSIELIYTYDSNLKEYVLLYAKQGTVNEREYQNFNPPEETPTSIMWVYSERTHSIKYNAPDYPSLSVRDIKKGWNFIPVSPEMKGFSLNELAGNCVYEEVYTYAEENGVTQWIDLKSLLNDKRMLEEASSSGLQLVIKVKDDCRMGVNSDYSIPALPDLNDDIESTPTTEIVPMDEFPANIGSFVLNNTQINTEDCNEFNKEELCVSSTIATYKDFSNNQVVFVHLVYISKGEEVYRKYIDNSGKDFQLDNGEDAFRLENHEIGWFFRKGGMILTQEGTFTQDNSGESYSYGTATGNNEVTKYFLNKYTPEI